MKTSGGIFYSSKGKRIEHSSNIYQCRLVKKAFINNDVQFGFFDNLFAFGDLLFALTQKVSKKVKGCYKNEKIYGLDFSWRNIRSLLHSIVILVFRRSLQTLYCSMPPYAQILTLIFIHFYKGPPQKHLQLTHVALSKVIFIVTIKGRFHVSKFNK